MANITAHGDTLTITSAITMEKFEKVQRYAPEILTLTDEEGSEKFKVMFQLGAVGVVTDYGICFSSATPEGNLFMTTSNLIQGMHNDLSEERKMITDRFALILTKIRTVEMQIDAWSDSIDSLERQVQSDIHICGEPVDPAETREEVVEEA